MTDAQLIVLCALVAGGAVGGLVLVLCERRDK